MNESPNTDVSGTFPLIRRHITSWKSKTPHALVFDPSRPEQVIEKADDEGNKENNDIKIPLPRWRNRVHIYEEPDKNRGYIFTIRLDRLGFVKNMRRRLKNDYKVLYVKGSEYFG